MTREGTFHLKIVSTVEYIVLVHDETCSMHLFI